MSKNNIAPNWCKHAIATNKGWVDHKTGELLVSVRTLHIDSEPKPVVNVEYVKEPVEPVSVIIENLDEYVEEEINPESMTKAEIEAYAKKTFNVNLDKRKSKVVMIEKLEELMNL